MRLHRPPLAAAARALALVALLAALAFAVPSALAQGSAPERASTTAARAATAPAAGADAGARAPATTRTAADPESQLIPEGSSRPTSIDAGGAGTLLRLLIGLVIVVGLITAVWYVMKRVQRSRFPALEERGSGLVEIVTTTPLGPNRSLHLIRVGDDLLLIGSADGGITPITTLDREQAAALVDLAPPAPRFGAPPGGPGGPGADDRARAVATAGIGSLVERLRAMTTRR
ncbi:flagellar biosynthetic protein FliO [Miltoncostaea marina]|uniref:flagellar biosynthetic protein FliO n=1 Tax=Miltoncostaea marina TaxID=2843215 RepID=UPI001C3D2441|nr:flagellar biosynthetic protein FliO [Miltoncostaea marina]